MKYAALLLGLAVGCGGGGGDDDGDDDAPADARTFDAAIDAGGETSWVQGYLQEVVGKLSGNQEIAPGVTLTARASNQQRDISRQYVFDELTALGLEPTLYDYGTGANVIAILPATSAGDGQLVVLGAHFDGVAAGPAAADDGTGVALVLAAARYFVDQPDRARPLAFALFDQEEIGLIGSGNWADSLVQDGVAVAEVHCFDMISFDGDGDRAVELWSPTAALDEKWRAHAGPLDIPVRTVTFTSSDHQSFLLDGFVATGVGEEFVSGDHTPHYHLASDTYDKIDFPYLTSITLLAFDVIADQ